MEVKHVAASHCGEGGCYGVEGVVSVCCGDQGRDREYGGACNGDLGHNASLHHCPLGPCRRGVCEVVASSGDGMKCSPQ